MPPGQHSAMNRLPAPSAATWHGTTLSASVVMIPSGETLRMRPLPDIRDEQVARAVHRHAGRRPSPALVAGPPSPRGRQLSSSQAAPLPATVVMIPAGETLRTFPSAMKRLPALSTARPPATNCALVAGPPSPE